MASEARRIPALIRRLSSVPNAPEEVRAFMQRRVSILLAVCAVLWTSTWFIDRTIWFLTSGSALPRVAGGVYYVWVHFACAAMLGLGWLVLRGRKPSLEQLSTTESAATLLQVAGYCLMMVFLARQLQFGLELSLVLAHVLVIRAALVPTSPWRTAVIGVLGTFLVVLTTFEIQARSPARPEVGPSALFTELAAGLWGVVTVVTTTAISFVIYGLQERVRAAMELGQYTLLDKIGEGGMGVVYRAKHALLRRATAVKLLRAENAKAETIARFEREVQLTANISHPNVVSVYDFGSTPDGSFYYAMEFLCGVDLQHLITSHGPQAVGRVVPILAQAADALDEAHSIGLIHRDVKPANMILCNSARHPDRLKVFDFGLVKNVQGTAPDVSQTKTDALTGTPLYMSPEAITAPDSIDARADIYALGAVGYFLLTGVPVFEGDSIIDVCARHLHEPVVPPSERSGAAVPKPLEDLILACLAKSPGNRPASAAAFRRRLLELDLPIWSADEARAWWAGHRYPTSPKDVSVSEVTRTLAVVPRSQASDTPEQC